MSNIPPGEEAARRLCFVSLVEPPAKSFVQPHTVTPHAPPVLHLRQGFPEIVRHGETIKLFTGTAGPEEVESFLSQKVSLPEVCVSV